MKRRDKGISNAWSFLLGFVILTVVVPGVLIGPARAVRLIGSAVSSTILQTPSQPEEVVAGGQQLPIVDIADPGTELVINDIHFPIRSIGTAGDRTIIEIDSSSRTPFGPFTKLVIESPGADLLGGPLALWIAGRIGVPIPFHTLVQLHRDGSDVGVHQLKEYVDHTFERDRNLTGSDVNVVRVKDGLDPEIDPWGSTDHWDLPADGDAAKQFTSLIEVINDSLITPADRRSQMELLIEVDAFNAFHAAAFMLGATREDPASMVLVLDPRTLKYYPVLTDAPLVPSADGTIAGEGYLIEKRMMAISDWRSQRDGLVKDALQEIHASGAFDRKLTALSGSVRPSAKAVGNSRRPLFSMQGSASSAGLQWSADDIRKRVAAHWDRILPVVSGGTIPSDPVTP